MIPSPAPGNSRRGILTVQTPEEVTADIESRKNADLMNPESMSDPVIISLASHIRDSFTAARRAKDTGADTSITERLLKCDRMRAGKYDPSFQRELEEQGGSDIYMLLADVKCRSLEAWLKDAMLPTGERPFHLDPTPIPELPPDVAQGVLDGVMRFFREGVQSGRISAGDISELGPKAIKKM